MTNAHLRLATLLTLFFIVIPTFAQQSQSAKQKTEQAASLAKAAAKAEMCHGEASLWKIEADDWFKAEHDKDVADEAKAGSGLPNKTTVNEMGMEEIDARAKEMGNCKFVTLMYDSDKAAGAQDMKLCDEVEHSYSQISYARLVHFVLRHHLYAQFLEEDATGQR